MLPIDTARMPSCHRLEWSRTNGKSYILPGNEFTFKKNELACPRKDMDRTQCLVTLTGSHVTRARSEFTKTGNDFTYSGSDLTSAGSDLTLAGSDITSAGSNLTFSGRIFTFRKAFYIPEGFATFRPYNSSNAIVRNSKEWLSACRAI